MVRIEQVTSEAEIGRLRPEWQALWLSVPDASPFLSPEWLLSWWDCFGNGAPLLLTAREEGQLIAVLPLYHHSEPECYKLMPIGISLSDYSDALVTSGRPGLTAALLESIAGLPCWDECYLPELPPGAALLEAQWPTELIVSRHIENTCPVLSLPDAIAELRAVVPRKTLRDLRRARRRAVAAGATAAIPAGPSNVSELMQDLFRLHEDRWQPIAGHGVCADPVAQRFHLTAARRMLAAGVLRLYVLRVGGATAAAYYGFTAKDTAYAYLSGFDHKFAELSPGTQIVAHAIEEAVQEGAREFHFLRGGENYKYAWGGVDRPNTALTLRRRC
jgi:CelD/BcsL family acetyltransferase involved in cellulose biosynthesis